MIKAKKSKRNKRLLSVFLAVVILIASFGFAGMTASAGFSTQGPVERNVSLGSLDWSLKTIDGKTITKSTYSNKTVMFVFYRATMSGGEGLCYNSNSLIGDLVKCSWISNSDVQIVAVDVDENTKATVTSYKNTYAPDCDNIVFTYGSYGYLLYNLVSLYSDTSGGFSYTLAYCAIIKNNKLCYAWDSCSSAIVCQQALSNITSVPANDTSLDSQVDAVVAGGSYQIGDARSMLGLINDMRTGKDAWYWNSDNTTKTVLTNVGKLTYDYALEQLAMRRAAELVLSFSHTRPDGTSCFSLLYDGYRSYGENIAYGYTTVQSMFDGWAEELEDYSGQGHRRNMLNPNFTAVGIACFNYNGRLYWVQEFGYAASGISDPIGKFLDAPKLGSVSAASKGVTIKWGAVAGAAKYRVFYKENGESTWHKVVDTTSTSYNWTSAKYNTKYTFTVRCLDNDGKTYTSPYNTTGISYTLYQFNIPKISSVANTATGIKITWGKVTGAEKYRVFYKANGESSWHKVTDTTSTSYTWTKAASGTHYTFTVRCLSADGNTYTSDYDKTGKSIGSLSTPKLSSVSNTTTGVEIAWGKVSGALKYRVFYKKSGESSWHLAGDTTSTKLTWTKAVSGTKYTFTVRCLSSDGSFYTSAYDATGKSITYIAAPQISSLTSSASGITIKWGKVTGAEKYRVFYKAKGESSWHKVTDTTSTSCTWTGGKTGTTYIFTVRCLSADGSTYTSAYDPTGKSITK